MSTVTKKELAYRIAERKRVKKVIVKTILQQFLSEIIRELAAGNRLEFREFGVFEVKTRAARKARNPRTGDRVQVPKKAIVHFKAGRAMKQAVLRNEARFASESAPPGPTSGAEAASPGSAG